MIRPTTPDDTEALAQITSATGFFKPHEVTALREVLDDYFDSEAESDHVCITFDDGEVHGFAYFAPEPMAVGTWILWWIVVGPGSQGKGVGKKLMQHIENDVRHRGGRVIFIETSSLPFYEPTRQFYLKLGYEQEATLRDYYAAGDSKVVFRKAI
jgi:GNAT superfamily N-acetyltransferase